MELALIEFKNEMLRKNRRSILLFKNYLLRTGPNRLTRNEAPAVPAGRGEDAAMGSGPPGEQPQGWCDGAAAHLSRAALPGHLIPAHVCASTECSFFPSCLQGRQCVFLTFEGMIYKQPLVCLLTSFFIV